MTRSFQNIRKARVLPSRGLRSNTLGFCAVICAALFAALLSGCVKKVGDDSLPDTTRTVTTTSTVATTSGTNANTYYPVTLPLIDAFFADSSFARDAETKTGLTDADMQKVRDVARTGTASIRSSDSGSTTAAREQALSKLSAAIGQDKANKLIAYVQQRWMSGGDSTATAGSMTSPSGTYNKVPQDSRIVVNIPEFRMDVFDSGKIAKSYKVAIGYPEFPLPTGMRRASKIIFNPSWTTPDEPWVESSNKVQVGEKIKPGDKNNPLGIMKIPIGLPSLIHGGKTAGQIGNFGSHGCVGLTNDEAKDFVKQLAKLAGDSLTDKDVAADIKTKDKSKDVNLQQSVPVELRYETVVLENGVLHVFRDVYEHGTNTESTVNAVLAQYGSSLDKLNPSEQQQIRAALTAMSQGVTSDSTGSSRTAPASSNSTSSTSSVADSSGTKSKSRASTASDSTVHVTKSVPGAKEMQIPISELAGKGYPAMQTASTGSGKSSSTRKKK